MLFHFCFLFFFGITIEIIRGNTTTRKEDALDVVANTAGAALAVFCFFYILKRRLDKI
jgi:VanZ family protein